MKDRISCDGPWNTPHSVKHFIMKYGINLLLWTDSMHDGLIPTVESLKSMEYDGVEMPLFDPNKKL